MTKEQAKEIQDEMELVLATKERLMMCEAAHSNAKQRLLRLLYDATEKPQEPVR